MSGTDVIVVGVNDQPFAYDKYAQTEVTPPFDTDLGGTSDITVRPSQLLNGTYSNGTTEVYVKRKLDTGDKYDFVITNNVTTDFIYAYYPSNSFVYHQNNYGTGTLNLALLQSDLLLNVGSSDSYDDDYDIHGTEMTIVWMGLVPLTIMLARYFKWAYLWYWAHLGLGCITIGVTIASITLIFDKNEAVYADAIKTPLFHSRLGLSLVSIVFGQGAFGLLFRMLSKKTITPYRLAVIRDVHCFTGWTLMIIAFIEIHYGWDMYDDTQLIIVYVFYGIIVFLFILLELWRRYWYLIPSLGCRRTKVMMTHHAAMKLLYNENRKIAFYDELIIDVGKFADSHPGGKRFISETHGEDLGKYINGCSSYGKAAQPYYHSQGARLIVERLSIGLLSYHEGFVVGTEKQPSYQEMQWKLVGRRVLNGATRQLIYVHPDFSIARPKGVSWMGKHFRISKVHNYLPVYRYYSAVYCMTPCVVKDWREQIQSEGLAADVNLNEFELHPKYAEQVQTQDNVLCLIIKEYTPHGVISQYSTGMKIGKKINLKGPLGPGLVLSEFSAGDHIAFAGGTGIVPFLDLVYMIWRVETNQESFGLTDDFSLMMYVSFSTWKDTFAVDLLRATHGLCARNRSKRFFLHLCVDETTEQGRMTAEVLGSYVSIEKVTRAWTCGPSSFNRWASEMMLGMGLTREKLIVM